MAARTRKGTKEQGWDERTRSRIKTSMLINRLCDHVDGKCELASTQVTAALGLLRKTIPDLQAVELNLSGSVEHNVVQAKPLDADQWAAQYGASLNGGNGKANGNGATKH